ncbi:hypothetical protein [Helicobacter sp. T3_23-1056]
MDIDFACATAPTRAYALNRYFVAVGLCHAWHSHARNDGIAKSHNDRIFHSLAYSHTFCPPSLAEGDKGGVFVLVIASKIARFCVAIYTAMRK